MNKDFLYLTDHVEVAGWFQAILLILLWIMNCWWTMLLIRVLLKQMIGTGNNFAMEAHGENFESAEYEKKKLRDAAKNKMD